MAETATEKGEEPQIVSYVASEKMVLKQDTNVTLRTTTPKGHLDCDVILKAGTKITLTHASPMSHVYGLTIDIVIPYIVNGPDCSLNWFVEKKLLHQLQQRLPLQIPISLS